MHEANAASSIDRKSTAAGAFLGGLGVLLGAFGAHLLKGRVSPEALDWWHTAVEYQMWHALAVLAIGLRGATWTRLPVWLLTAGLVVFSGTLYAMALGAPRWLGAVTPLGGLAMIMGWGLLAFRANRRSARQGSTSKALSSFRKASGNRA